jgi:hypothetical protein
VTATGAVRLFAPPFQLMTWKQENGANQEQPFSWLKGNCPRGEKIPDQQDWVNKKLKPESVYEIVYEIKNHLRE